MTQLLPITIQFKPFGRVYLLMIGPVYNKPVNAVAYQNDYQLALVVYRFQAKERCRCGDAS